MSYLNRIEKNEKEGEGVRRTVNRTVRIILQSTAKTMVSGEELEAIRRRVVKQLEEDGVAVIPNWVKVLYVDGQMEGITWE